jgi:hypothetical protein
MLNMMSVKAGGWPSGEMPMDGNWLRWALILVLLAHGVGHIMGFMAAWTNVPMGFSSEPWLLSPGVTVQSSIGRVFGLLWLVARVAFLGGVFGLITHQSWWPTLIIAASVISLAAILPWWNTVASGPRFGAMAVDVLAIALLVPPWGAQLIRQIT